MLSQVLCDTWCTLYTMMMLGLFQRRNITCLFRFQEKHGHFKQCDQKNKGYCSCSTSLWITVYADSRRNYKDHHQVS